MNRILSITAVVALVAASSFAQDMQLGVRAGFNLLDFSFGEDYLDENVKMGMGFGVGLAAIVPISGEINLRTGAEFHYRKVSFGEEAFRANAYAGEFALSVPAIVQYSLGDAWVGAGLQIEIPFSSEIIYEFTAGDEREEFEDRSLADLGFAIGGGYNINENIGVDLKIILGMTALSNSEFIEDSSLWQYGIGVTYFF
ncbi:MAG: PorT family protein [Fibromonadales bacterium]|nr:PorT family protein [Fibromonadales bacterium]